MIKGIITGDVVDSTLIPNFWKPKVNETLKKVIADFKPKTPATIEMFRGDSFQIIVHDPSYTLSIGVAIRAALRMNTPEELDYWDARISIGIGEISFKTNSILTSDGEAFRLSGRNFDELGKKRLSINTSSTTINEELNLTTAFADDIITKWTEKQAAVMYARLINETSQKYLADSLGMKHSNYNKHWNLAHGNLILMYIDRFKYLINNKLII